MEAHLITHSDLHFEHILWRKEIDFWKDEIKSFQKRLDELVSRWTDEMVLAELGQYQNNFTIHNNKIEEFKEAIDAHEHNISKQYESQHEAMDRVYVERHKQLRTDLETQRHIYNDLKKRFFDFLSKYM
ncbi:hypothetical protein [Mangrovimonas aestuarii]|uniref:hypothetical protein n=1 Tax=Mangrovimonas aestuarii TaxID=3018443 RepID=UPI0023795195|nr:hypothetical protein [Mangrovimonas aestuarii]